MFLRILVSDGLHTSRGFLEAGLSAEASDMSDTLSFLRALRSAQASACSMPNVSWSPGDTLVYRTSGFHVHSYHQLQGKCSSLEVIANLQRGGYNSGRTKGQLTEEKFNICRCVKHSVALCSSVRRKLGRLLMSVGLRPSLGHQVCRSHQHPAIMMSSCCLFSR